MNDTSFYTSANFIFMTPINIFTQNGCNHFMEQPLISGGNGGIEVPPDGKQPLQATHIHFIVPFYCSFIIIITIILDCISIVNNNICLLSYYYYNDTVIDFVINIIIILIFYHYFYMVSIFIIFFPNYYTYYNYCHYYIFLTASILYAELWPFELLEI